MDQEMGEKRTTSLLAVSYRGALVVSYREAGFIERSTGYECNNTLAVLSLTIC